MGVPRGFTNGGTEPTVAKRRDPDGQTHSRCSRARRRRASKREGRWEIANAPTLNRARDFPPALSLHRALRGASTENATVTLFSVSSSLTPFLRL